MKLNVIFFGSTSEDVDNSPESTHAKIEASLTSISEGDFKSVCVKKLRGEIYEIKVKKYRLLFFVHENDLTVVKVFIKKTDKIPPQYIDQARRIYRLLTSNS